VGQKLSIPTAYNTLKNNRIFTLLSATKDLFIHQKPSRNFAFIKRKLDQAKNCLEIGGPSFMFQPNSFLPLYPILRNIDNVNLSNKTIWTKENNIFCKNWFRNEFILDATKLEGINEETYDCILSSHVLEHIANPLRALLEWKRVLKSEGFLLLILPHKSATFDHNRAITSPKHFMDDYEKNVDEHDLSHLPEILRLHDLSMDTAAKSSENFAIRSRNNFENRCMHHHVFVTESAICIMNQAEMKVTSVETYPPYHIIIFGEKPKIATNAEKQELCNHNLNFLEADVQWRKLSIFDLDKVPLYSEVELNNIFQK
jgi:SAM-dependent methyltransferase